MTSVAAGLMVFPNPTAGAVDAKAIRVASSNVITDVGTGQPTVVLATLIECWLTSLVAGTMSQR